MAKVLNGVLRVFRHNEKLFLSEVLLFLIQLLQSSHSWCLVLAFCLQTLSSVFTSDQGLAFKPRSCPRAQLQAASSHSSLDLKKQLWVLFLTMAVYWTYPDPQSRSQQLRAVRTNPLLHTETANYEASIVLCIRSSFFSSFLFFFNSELAPLAC